MWKNSLHCSKLSPKRPLSVTPSQSWRHLDQSIFKQCAQIFLKSIKWPNMVVQVYNPSIWKTQAETEGFRFEASLSYMAKCCQESPKHQGPSFLVRKEVHNCPSLWSRHPYCPQVYQIVVFSGDLFFPLWQCCILYQASRKLMILVFEVPSAHHRQVWDHCCPMVRW